MTSTRAGTAVTVTGRPIPPRPPFRWAVSIRSTDGTAEVGGPHPGDGAAGAGVEAVHLPHPQVAEAQPAVGPGGDVHGARLRPGGDHAQRPGPAPRRRCAELRPAPRPGADDRGLRPLDPVPLRIPGV